MENYTPFGFSDWQTEVAAIKKFASAGKKTAVVSTINGDANVPFYKELANEGIKATDIPVVAFSVGEEELSGMDTKNLVGHLAAWNYFESVKTPQNAAFIKQWHAFIKNDKRTTNDPMEAHYIGFKMWTQAVLQAGTTDVDAVRQAMIGQKVKNLTGSWAEMLPNHHLTKPVLIGEIRPDGQFDVVWKTPKPVTGRSLGLEISRRGQGQGRELDLPLGVRKLHRADLQDVRIATDERPGRPSRGPVRRLRFRRCASDDPSAAPVVRALVPLLLAVHVGFAATDDAKLSALVQQLGADDFDGKIAAVGELAAIRRSARGDDPESAGGRRSLRHEGQEDRPRRAGRRQFRRPSIRSAAPRSVTATSDDIDQIVVNNRVRSVIDAALGALNLFSANRADRLAAALDLDEASRRPPRVPALQEGAGRRDRSPRSSSDLTLALAGARLNSHRQAGAARRHRGTCRDRPIPTFSTSCRRCMTAPISIPTVQKGRRARARRDLAASPARARRHDAVRGPVARLASCCSPRSACRSPSA